MRNPNRSHKHIRGASETRITLARHFRQESTPAEYKLWQALRNRKLDGLKFHRQQALGPFFPDFICSEKRLIVEVDEDVHDEQIDYDAARTEHLEQYGYRVLRVRNDEVMYDISSVLRKIHEAALIPNPSPNSGRREENS